MSLKNGIVSNKISFIFRLRVKAEDIPRYLLYYKPTIVHLSGLIEIKGKIIIESKSNFIKTISSKDLGLYLKEFQDYIHCVVINGNSIKEFVNDLSESIDCVIGLDNKDPISSSYGFIQGFYKGIANGNTIKTAISIGRIHTKLINDNTKNFEVIYIDKSKPDKFLSIETIEKENKVESLIDKAYDFFDIEEIEKASGIFHTILKENPSNLLAIRGLKDINKIDKRKGKTIQIITDLENELISAKKNLEEMDLLSDKIIKLEIDKAIRDEKIEKLVEELEELKTIDFQNKKRP